MKNKKLIVGLIFLIAVLVIGIGYAAINNIELKVGGTTNATTAQGNFQVAFTEVKNVSDSSKVEASIDESDKLTAVMNVSGLTAKGDTVTATYEIKNTSPDLSAELTAAVTKNTNSTYFQVTQSMADPITIAKDKTTTVTVTVELVKTPITAEDEAAATGEIEVTVTAKPVQP